MTRPRIGISACLLGQRVRYDGRDKYAPDLIAFLRARVELVPFCPETGAGLGVPRPPVQLVRSGDGEIRMLGVSDPHLDVSLPVRQWIKANAQQFATLDGFVLKDRSPSCGYQSAPLMDSAGQVISTRATGLFAEALSNLFPGMVLVESASLETEQERLEFVNRLGAGENK